MLLRTARKPKGNHGIDPHCLAHMTRATSVLPRLLAAASQWLLAGRDVAPEERRGVTFLLATCGVAAGIGVVTLAMLPPPANLPVLAFLVAVVAVPLLLRIGVRPLFVHGIALGAATVFLTVMCLLQPRLYLQQLYWFAMLPLCGGLLVGRRGLLLGTLAATAGTGCVLAVHAGTFAQEAPFGITLAQATIDVAVFLCGVAGLTAMYVGLHTDAVRRAEHAARARGAFLAQMSHELRTPMNGVLGMLQLHDEAAAVEVRREQLQLMRRSGEAMVAIIDDLLDFSRLEAEELQLADAPFEPGQVVRDAVSLYQPQAADKGLALLFTIAPDMPARLSGDALRIGQVLRNLVSNAVKFTPAGRVHIELGWQDELLTGTVTDDGIGVPPETIPYLFTPFRQANANTANHFGGSGLGLAICRGLCRRMGGDIEVQSVPGQGSRFTFTCRVRLGAAAPDTASDASPSARRLSGHVLLVDDNEVNRTVGARFCERAGLVVTLAHDGEAALSALAGARFDLVLMDCQMPTMDGFEATRRIRALPDATARVPIIAVTASTLPEEVQRCREVGMDDVVAKPLNGRTLHAVLARHLKTRPD
jgi:hypothetical protein